jgi:hypothetical protein
MENTANNIAKIYGYHENVINNCLSIVSTELKISNNEIIDVLLDETLAGDYLNTEDFIYKSFDVNIDDQKFAEVPFNKQEYVSRDFTKLVIRRFPKFDEVSYIPSKFKWGPFWEVQKRINSQLIISKDLNWTNQTLSYTRDSVIAKHMVNCIVRPLYDSGFFNNSKRSNPEKVKPEKVKPWSTGLTVVDATANTGGDSITFALEKFVNKVISYEIFKPVYEMLVRNVDLYGLKDKIEIKNKRFDYNIPEGSLVIIDPPYESAFNSEISKDVGSNFNLSIDPTPIYNVAKKCLSEGAKCVMLTMPKNFQYNKKFAVTNGQHVEVYQMGKKNNKIFLVMNLEDVLHRPNFKFYKVVQSGVKNKQGKVNPYKCKIED